MYCVYCGSQLSGEALFCHSCGAKQNVQSHAIPSNNVYYNNTEIIGETKYSPHPYLNVGGWLSFITFFSFIFLVALDFILLIGLTQAFGDIYSWQRALVLSAVFGFGLASVFGWMATIGVRIKNAKFIRYFECFVMILAITACLMAYIIFSNNIDETIKQIFISAVPAFIIVIYVWTAYFLKSVRIRTYFGSDEYLRHSLFFSKTTAPKPIDINAYNQSQILARQQSNYHMNYTYDAPSTGFAVLGFFFPVIGLILYLVWREFLPQRAKSTGKGAIVGVIVYVALCVLLYIIALFT